MKKGIVLDDSTGDLAVNVLRDAKGQIISGLTLGNTDYQDIKQVVLAAKGDFKEHPVLGVNPESYLKSVGQANSLRREISVQLETVGFGKADVKVLNNGVLEINV